MTGNPGEAALFGEFYDRTGRIRESVGVDRTDACGRGRKRASVDRCHGLVLVVRDRTQFEPATRALLRGGDRLVRRLGAES
jgi:hypothetical protein